MCGEAEEKVDFPFATLILGSILLHYISTMQNTWKFPSHHTVPKIPNVHGIVGCQCHGFQDRPEEFWKLGPLFTVPAWKSEYIMKDSYKKTGDGLNLPKQYPSCKCAFLLANFQRNWLDLDRTLVILVNWHLLSLNHLWILQNPTLNDPLTVNVPNFPMKLISTNG